MEKTKLNFTLKLTLFLSAVILLASCSNEARSSATVYKNNSSGSNIDAPVGQTQWTTCPQTTSSAIGAIYDSSGGYNYFENNIKAFLSSFVSPDEVGTISSMPNGSTGVRLQGQVKLQSDGAVDTAQSKISIKIYDSFAVFGGASNYGPIPIEIHTAFSGQFNQSTGAGYVVFKDKYGEIKFEGQLDNQYFKGTVSYTNYVNVTGAQPASGLLGQFYIARCGFIQ